MSNAPTTLPADSIRSLLRDNPAGRVHLLGIGGVGMAALAGLLRARGFMVDGCDLQRNRFTARLEETGIQVAIPHDPAHLEPVPTCCVCSTAVPLNQPECGAACDQGIPLARRGDVLAALLRDEAAIAICGTHGKTTTTAMTVHTLRATCGLPTFLVGGDWEAPGRVFEQGPLPLTVVEADESDGTLAVYNPAWTVVTGIDYDHMEHFASESAFLNVFAAVLRQTQHTIIYCRDDPRLTDLVGRTDSGINRVAYGLHSTADWRAMDLESDGAATWFTLMHLNQEIGRFRLPVPGRHNVQNALAALSVVAVQGGDVKQAAAALAEFQPVRRRFESLGTWRGVPIYSDYAHHPTEIKALLQTARSLARRRVLAIFQPHRYTRTRTLGPDFPAAFEGVDWLVLAPVYPASESPLPGGTTENLAQHFAAGRPGIRCSCARDLSDAWRLFVGEAQPGDILLLVGAGDIEQLAEHVRADDETI